MEKSQNAVEAPAIANAIGRLVIVRFEYRKGPDDDWHAAPGYEPWQGQVMQLPESSNRNGNVFVMPDQPRGEGLYYSMHPRICDMTPRLLGLPGEAHIETRHNVEPTPVTDGLE